MNVIILKNRLYEEAVSIASITGFCLVMLALRIKLSHDFFLIFMGWNLFLALIPYGMTWLIKFKSDELKRFPSWFRNSLITGFIAVWFLFLPNAPYMITDLKHLQISATYWWIDALLLSSFAIAGVILFYKSLDHFLDVFLIALNSSKIRSLITHFVVFTCSFGVYLGRSLRYNSWDILSNPTMLFQDIINLILSPQHHGRFWSQVILLSIILSVSYYLYGKILKK